jgi:hypothetical protein
MRCIDNASRAFFISVTVSFGSCLECADTAA